MSREKKIGFCESCSTDDVEVIHYEGGPGLADRDLCEFCAGTIVGNFTRPHGSPSNRDVAIAMVQIAHMLVEKLKAGPQGTATEGGAG